MKTKDVLILTHEGKTTGITLEIPSEARRILVEAVKKGEGECRACGRAVFYEPGEYYWLSQSAFEVKHLVINIICRECSGPICEAIQGALGHRGGVRQDVGADRGVCPPEAEAPGRV